MLDLWKNKKINNEDFESYLIDVKNIASAAEFSAMVYDSKGDIYIGQERWGNDGFIKLDNFLLDSMKSALMDNKFSIAGSIAGSFKGFKAAPNNPFAKFAGLAAGGAIGSIAGGVVIIS